MESVKRIIAADTGVVVIGVLVCVAAPPAAKGKKVS